MSEKEQRELLDRYRELAHDIYSIEAVGDLQALYDDAAEALAKDPDVVKLCREFLAEAETERREKRHNYIIIMATLEKVALWLQAKFHFRLTDDGGYEWTS